VNQDESRLHGPVQAQSRALEELAQKTLCDIHQETAIKWAWRGRAAHVLWLENPESTWRDDFVEYRHEAVEHASLANDEFATLELVRHITNGLETDTPALQAALAELRQKNLDTIQKETCVLWAYRAWAAYRLERTVDGVDFEQEAWEHAALSEDNGMFARIKAIIAGV